jgi:lipopolysaccharide/colanic/teichoic acid biosynthesis glycosyltransferase
MRLFDIFVSFVFLLILSPLFIFLIFLLKFTGEGEIFFFQERVGYHGVNFKVMKFATMLKNSPNMGSGTITSKNDQRILSVGRFLRKTKINELPQLWNVLRGDMSLIGPRPHAQRDLEGVSDDLLKLIHNVRPGLSGVGSLIFRNEEEILQQFEDPRNFYDSVIAPYKAELEIWYVYNRSFSLYIILLFLTAYVVVLGNNRIVYRLLSGLPGAPTRLVQYL